MPIALTRTIRGACLGSSFTRYLSEMAWRNQLLTGLWSLKYNDINSETWYRIGEVGQRQCMEQILHLQPAFTEVVTWVRDKPQSQHAARTY
jgi:hypothetical protein